MDPRTRLKDLAVSDSGFLFDPYSGATFTANPTGLAVLHGLKKGHGREQILEELKEAFDVRDSDLHRDLDEFLHLLREQDILPRDFVLE